MDKRSFSFLFVLASLVYITGLGVDIMGVDSPQYAALSREIVETGNFLQLKLIGNDYLDKPPLLFWVSSLFFKLFGYHNWSFKIGSFLFTLLGVYSTFRTGKLLYTARVGRLAAIILYSCQAFFLFNNDVRTDTILTGSAIFSIWQLLEWLRSYRWKWLLGASFGIALAMLAKGPVGLMVPVLAVASYLAGYRRWRDFFRWQYLVLLAVVALLLTPMLWGLYTQFDLQPEKTVAMVTSDGVKYEKNVSGLRFYLWTQSFGRITGENAWKDSSGPFFFVHNFLWSFMPWSLLFLPAFYWRIRQWVLGLTKGQSIPELLTLGGFLLPFIVLSMSSYKLPHYIFILFPLSAILLAAWWEQRVWQPHLSRGLFRLSLGMQVLVLLISLAVTGMIFFWFFPGAPWYLMLLSFGSLLAGAVLMFKPALNSQRLIFASVLISGGVNFTLNSWFYPRVLDYQAGSQMVYRIEEARIPKDQVYSFNYFNFGFIYYFGNSRFLRLSPAQISSKLKAGEEVYLVALPNDYQLLQDKFEVQVVEKINTHSATRLNLKFLNPETRGEKLKPLYLVKVTHNL